MNTTYIESHLKNAALEAWYDKAMLNIAANIPTLKSIISECPDKKADNMLIYQVFLSVKNQRS